MPSVTDVSQQSANNLEKSTQQTTDSTSTDPLVQSLLLLEKKQRNLVKRKDRLESFRKEEASGKELHKDQKETLAKYPEVLGQIECVKELIEQQKKIQLDSSKNQKRLLKQVTEEKRVLVSQRVREYAQIRYLLDHRPTSLQPDESSLLDELSSILIPSDNSTAAISRSVDTVLAIYQAGPSTALKSVTGKTPQEVREVLDRLLKDSNVPPTSSSEAPPPSSPPPLPPRSLPSPPPPTPPLPTPVEQEQTKEVEEVNDIGPSREHFSEYPLRFDTRTQKTPLEQVIQDSLFFSDDNQQEQSPDPNEYLQTLTVVNSNLTDQVAALNENPTNLEQQTDEQWQQNRRGNGNNQRNGQYHNGNRNYRGGYNNYYNQQQWPGQRGRYDNSYGGGQRPYNENYRGRGGGYNPNYRGHRGGGYRGGNRGYNNNNNNTNNNGDENPKSAQYQHAGSAPAAEQQ